MKILIDIDLTQDQINSAVSRLIGLVDDHAPGDGEDEKPFWKRFDDVVFLINSLTGYQIYDKVHDRIGWLKNKGG